MTLNSIGQPVPKRGRQKLDFERMIGDKCGPLDVSIDDNGMYMCPRVRDLFTAFKLGMRNIPARNPSDGAGVQSVVALLDANNVPHLVRAFDFRNSAIRAAKSLAYVDRCARFGVYSLYTVVYNPLPRTENVT